MTCRERVLKTLAHEETEIVPYQIDLTDEAYKKLETYLSDKDFYKKMGGHLAQERNESFTELSDTLFRDMFGVVWSREQEGDFGIVKDVLLTEPTLKGYTFPVPDEPLIRKKCEKLEAQKDKFRMYIIGFSLYERAWTLRSIPEFLMDMIASEDFAHELLERIVAYNKAVVEIVAEYDIDCIFYGDDWGQQKGLIMSPAKWREFIKPGLKELYSQAKEKGFYVAQHSCGDISDVFGDLVELGLDIYNTFQPEIYDIEKMKKLYGNHVTFYGGVSTQQLLPFATPGQVKEETRRLMKTLGRGGGYIVAPTHAIPNDVPVQNILAFAEAIQNQGK